MFRFTLAGSLIGAIAILSLSIQGSAATSEAPESAKFDAEAMYRQSSALIEELPEIPAAASTELPLYLGLQTAWPEVDPVVAELPEPIPFVPAPELLFEAPHEDVAELPAAPASVLPPAANAANDKELVGELAKISDTEERKQAFVDLMLPLIEDLNAAILLDRHHLERLQKSLRAGLQIDDREVAWLEAIAKAYKVEPLDLEELLVRVDIVPASIALSQAALESGWGTSRLARKKLALFGQTDGGSGFASFRSLAGGVSSYFRNLNTHPAYRDFRAARAEARQQDAAIDGYDLARYLTRYSELGPAYVRKVRGLMRSNDFHLLQEAMLLVP